MRCSRVSPVVVISKKSDGRNQATGLFIGNAIRLALPSFAKNTGDVSPV
jgi:hypothetical protein